MKKVISVLATTIVPSANAWDMAFIHKFKCTDSPPFYGYPVNTDEPKVVLHYFPTEVNGVTCKIKARKAIVIMSGDPNCKALTGVPTGLRMETCEVVD